MSKELCVFEDSSQCFFGGGQRVTLDVLKVVVDNYDSVTIFDYCDDSEFLHRAKSLNVNVVKLMNFKGVLFFCALFVNYLIVAKAMFNRRADVYVTTKKGMLYGFIFKLLGESSTFHHHNVEESSKLGYYSTYLLLLFDRIICVSNSSMSSLPALILRRSRVSVVYNHVDFLTLPDNQTHSKRRGVRFVFLGSLIPIKGVELLIRAFLSREELDSCELHIYGAGECLTKLRALAKGDKRVYFNGFTSEPYSALVRGDVLVLPTLIPEACPMCIIEAHSVGLPAIVSDIGGQSELLSISNYGSTFNSGSVEDCARVLVNYTDPVYREVVYKNSQLEVFLELFGTKRFNANIRRAFDFSKEFGNSY